MSKKPAAGSGPETVPFVDLIAQYRAIAAEVDAAFHEVTGSAEYILGARVQQFEVEFAQFVSADHAVGVGSGLDALRLGLLALEGSSIATPRPTTSIRTPSRPR